MAKSALNEADMFTIGLVSSGMKHWQKTGKTRQRLCVTTASQVNVIEVRIVNIGGVVMKDICGEELKVWQKMLAERKAGK